MSSVDCPPPTVVEDPPAVEVTVGADAEGEQGTDAGTTDAVLQVDLDVL